MRAKRDINKQQRNIQYVQNSEKCIETTDTTKKEEYSDSDSSILFDDDEEENEQYTKQQENMEKQQEQYENETMEYGEYQKCTTLEELAEQQANTSMQTYILVHIYKNEINTCQSQHQTFEVQAKQFRHVGFFRMKVEDAFNNKVYDTIALPTLQLYRGSKLYKTYYAIGKQLNEDMSEQNIVQFLAKEGILQNPANQLRAEITRRRKECNINLKRHDKISKDINNSSNI